VAKKKPSLNFCRQGKGGGAFNDQQRHMRGNVWRRRGKLHCKWVLFYGGVKKIPKNLKGAVTGGGGNVLLSPKLDLPTIRKEGGKARVGGGKKKNNAYGGIEIGGKPQNGQLQRWKKKKKEENTTMEGKKKIPLRKEALAQNRQKKREQTTRVRS